MVNGRYEIALPFKENVHPLLGKSQEGALQRFKSLERRLAADQQLHDQYASCIEEYLQLGHMSEVNEDELRSLLSSTSCRLKGNQLYNKVEGCF